MRDAREDVADGLLHESLLLGRQRQHPDPCSTLAAAQKLHQWSKCSAKQVSILMTAVLQVRGRQHWLGAACHGRRCHPEGTQPTEMSVVHPEALPERVSWPQDRCGGPVMLMTTLTPTRAAAAVAPEIVVEMAVMLAGGRVTTSGVVAGGGGGASAAFDCVGHSAAASKPQSATLVSCVPANQSASPCDHGGSCRLAVNDRDSFAWSYTWMHGYSLAYTQRRVAQLLTAGPGGGGFAARSGLVATGGGGSVASGAGAGASSQPVCACVAQRRPATCTLSVDRPAIC